MNHSGGNRYQWSCDLRSNDKYIYIYIILIYNNIINIHVYDQQYMIFHTYYHILSIYGIYLSIYIYRYFTLLLSYMNIMYVFICTWKPGGTWFGSRCQHDHNKGHVTSNTIYHCQVMFNSTNGDLVLDRTCFLLLRLLITNTHMYTYVYMHIYIYIHNIGSTSNLKFSANISFAAD